MKPVWLGLSLRVCAAACVALAGLAAPTAAQVTFENVEAALQRLEAQSPTTPQPGGPLPPPRGGTTLPPSGADGDALRGGMGGGTVEPLPVPEDITCDQNLPDLQDAARDLTADSEAQDANAQQLEARFETLEQDFLTVRVDQTLSQCPVSFQNDVEAFQSALEALNYLERYRDAEVILICAQRGTARLNERMDSLLGSTDPNALQDRTSIGDLLRRWAPAEAAVTESISRYGFLAQWRDRRQTANAAMLRHCDLMENPSVFD